MRNLFEKIQGYGLFKNRVFTSVYGGCKAKKRPGGDRRGLTKGGDWKLLLDLREGSSGIDDVFGHADGHDSAEDDTVGL